MSAMTYPDGYVKTCPNCRNDFKTDNKDKRFCDLCLEGSRSELEGSTSETVDHPIHYNIGEIEVIDAIESWQLDFCAGNVIMYVARYQHKGSPVDDLKKARFYIDRLIKGVEKE